MTETIWLIVFACSLTVMLIIKKLTGTKHALRSVVFSMLLGIAVLAGVNLCSVFTGVSMPVSRLSLAGAAVLGVPGVTAMLLLQVLL